ncbi:hypothetical protein LJC07_06165 [Christensenellaceae bacterium OttesenSCG-928-L17]|nr:hypothetical protein [Christensenellaceae bacterium OttesenSCG-928-L17]
MYIKRFSIPGYAHLYRSLLRFCKLSETEAKELCYLWNTANLDSIRYAMPDEFVIESDAHTFFRCMDRMLRRPYRTEVQLYKALAALRHNIAYDALTERQREALARLRCIMRDLDYYFFKAYGVDIDDKRTVYAECRFHLLPFEDEPGVCMWREWRIMPCA